VLDRVFISPELEEFFPLCSLVAETTLGSDHTPPVFDSGDGLPPRTNRFFFESEWFERPDFCPMLSQLWIDLAARARGRDIIDWWHHMNSGLRQYLCGWSRNQGAATRREKSALLAQIEQLDARADSLGLDEEEWAERYTLEDQLLHIVREEEDYWQQRGRTKWALQGDANTAYFHAVANGRRRKCTISTIVTPSGPTSDPNIIQQVIYNFYHELLGSSS
jgi:mannosylglycoprotein endo-beta-mannosidase